MRTIKFRGRHLCGQWYYGNIILRGGHRRHAQVAPAEARVLCPACRGMAEEGGHGLSEKSGKFRKRCSRQ